MRPQDDAPATTVTRSLIQATTDAVARAISSLNLQSGASATQASSAILDLPPEQNEAALPLLNAAAVVSAFSTKSLASLFGQAVSTAGGSAAAALIREIAKHSRRITVGVDKGNHSLDLAIRRAVFRALGSREKILQVAETFKADPSDTAGVVLREFLRGELHPLSSLNRAKLVALGTIRRWLEGIVDGLPSDEAITARLAEVDLLVPLDRLLRHGFVGRETELRSLREYVDAIPSQSFGETLLRFTGRIVYAIIARPPLMIFGPGGVGKSTLVAKFIVDHLKDRSGRRTPFVYIDFDRVIFREPEPTALLLDILRQLAVQYPSMRSEVDGFSEELVRTARRFDELESAKSTTDDEFIFDQITKIVRSHVTGSAPILLVLDSFEELQFLGREIVYNYIMALDRLLWKISRLRIVIAGRSDIADAEITTKKVELPGFDPQSAEAFLKRYLDEKGKSQTSANFSTEIIAAAVHAVGGSPLTLVLAAENLIRAAEEGQLGSIDEVVTFIKELEETAAQQQLYGRFLEHLHDKALQAVAYPGLVLRRIDAEVLLKVLAKPCGLKVALESEAQNLVDSLRREGALVDPEDSGSGVRHRPDVRGLMLPDIEKSMPQKMHSIERRAASYYHARFERTAAPQDRAEEIYHRMRLGSSSAALDKLWIKGVQRYLEDAIEEVPPQQRFWLTEKLRGGTDSLSTESLDQAQWERVVERRARNLLAAGNARRAIDELSARNPETFCPGSPLFALFVDGLRLLGNTGRALELIAIGTHVSDVAGAADTVADLALHEAVIHESHRSYVNAIEALRRIDTRQSDIGRHNRLRFYITKARLLRKMIRDKRDERAERQRTDVLAQAVLLLDRAMMQDLLKRPSLLRESTAELAADRGDLLESALRTIGIELIDTDIVEATAEALEQWDAFTIDAGPETADEETSTARKSSQLSLTRRFGRTGKKANTKAAVRGAIWNALIRNERKTPDFNAWLLSRKSADPARDLARLLPRYPLNAQSAQAFGEVYALIVDRTIERRIRRTA